jgi:stage II sporulation protein D
MKNLISTKTSLIALLIALLFSASAKASEDLAPEIFKISGSGYGHGVGMSQIGARGQAIEGKSAVEILNYYYPGTTVSPYPDNELIRVNLANLTTSVIIKAVGAVGTITLFRGDLAAGEDSDPLGTYQGDLTASFTNLANSVIPSLSSPTAKFAPVSPNKAWTLRWDSATTTIALTNQGETKQYKYGQIVIKSVSNAVSSYLAVTNTLRLHDEYLWGIGEVPSSWPPAALEAQAIAARTYALTKLSRVRTECDCQIYSTTVDQNFVGYSKEIERTYGIRWKEAVNRTFVDANLVLVITFESKPINAFYSSSSGGSTQDVRDVWGSSIAYLQGVPDPWSLDMKINPRYAIWERQVTQKDMATAFGLDNVKSFRVDSRSKTESALSVTAFSSTGKSSTLKGEIFRARTKLPSTWIKDPINIEVPKVTITCENRRYPMREFCLQ